MIVLCGCGLENVESPLKFKLISRGNSLDKVPTAVNRNLLALSI